MFVCLCRAVTDHEICDAIDAGARTIDDVSRASGAGSHCQGCWPALQQLLDGEPLEHAVKRRAHSAA